MHENFLKKNIALIQYQFAVSCYAMQNRMRKEFHNNILRSVFMNIYLLHTEE